MLHMLNAAPKKSSLCFFSSSVCDGGSVDGIGWEDYFSTKDEWTHQEQVINTVHNVLEIENALWECIMK